ncbi:alanine racemase [Epibacterium sp. Ofav1-8]|uniref:alanine racemase n=1 Tax=Epibacterium sp. Ofav1-8 TaxID=2917735 RepID=UPI001EF58134|nr:alanine racemase [Epibacterium sp. Ofav1-8]MCG7626077.1 alanine racemase [Epibacterium sp. Ofav1-8]
MNKPAFDPKDQRARLDARPVWAEIDLDAITRNVARVREMAPEGTRLIVPIKANAYGLGAVEITRHLAGLDVDGIATADVDTALAIRAAGIDLRILVYGAQLPEGNDRLVANDLTPTVYDAGGVAALAALAKCLDRVIPVHMKVDAGLGRLGVRLDDACALAVEIEDTTGLYLEGVYTHIPYADPAKADWSQRRLNAFADVVTKIEAQIGRSIDFAQAAASSVMLGGFPDPLNTVSPGHLVFGLPPIAGIDILDHGFTPALRALKTRIIHINHRWPGDDLPTPVAEGAGIDTAVVLYGMANGYASAAEGRTSVMLCRGQECPVLGVSAEYTILDISACADASVGDEVTIIGADGAQQVRTEQVAADLGAPSAAYWMVGLRDLPRFYLSEE